MIFMEDCGIFFLQNIEERCKYGKGKGGRYRNQENQKMREFGRRVDETTQDEKERVLKGRKRERERGGGE